MEEIIELGKVELTNSGGYTKSNGVSNIGSSGIAIGSSSGSSVLNTNSYVTYSYPYQQTESYVVFKLPRDQMPYKVYVCGRLSTLGKLGQDVQAAYDGDNKLVFKIAEFNTFYTSNKITVSLEYDDTIYHYNINHNHGVILFKSNSNVVDAILVSEIEQ